MKREKRPTKRERKELNPARPTPQTHQHIHCIACGRQIEPTEFTALPPKALYLTCEHKHDFPSCGECQVTARYLILEHERTGNPVQTAKMWH